MQLRHCVGLTRFLLLRSAGILVLPIAANGQIFANQDQVLVGSMAITSYSEVNSIKLPSFTNQKFCSLVKLAPNTLVWAYVPTALERNGNFSAFPGTDRDPVTNNAFPGNLIPANRIPSVFAWRLAPSGPGLGDSCVAFPSNVVFATVSSITNRVSGDALFATPTQIALSYKLGSTPSTTSFTVDTFSRSQISFVLQPGTVTGPKAAVPPSLVFTPLPCCTTPSITTPTTPSTVKVTVSPNTSLPPGVYTIPVTITPINTIGGKTTVTATITVTAPPTWLTTDTNIVSFAGYQLGSGSSEVLTVRITSLGAGANFSILPTSTSPPGVNWFTVTPAFGVGPQPLLVKLNAAVLNKLGRGNYTGYFDIFAQSSVPGGVPNTPLRVMVFASVFPDPAFTISPVTLGFAYISGGPTPASATFSIDEAKNTSTDTSGFSFTPTVIPDNATDPTWIKVTRTSANPAGLPATYLVSADAAVLAQLSEGDHTAYISLNSPTGSTDTTEPNSNTAGRVVATIAVTGALGQLSATQTQVLAHVADGGGWQTRIVLVNTDTVNPAPITMRFWPGQDTPAMLLPVLTTGALTDFTLNDTIPAGGSRTYLTQGASSPPLWQGWIELTAPIAVGGTAVFRHNLGATQDNEGAVPLKVADGSRFVLPFDCSAPDATHSFGTSMAIINTDGTAAAAVTVEAYDENGRTIGLPATASSFALGARGHQAFELTNRFGALAGRRGTVVFTTTGGQLAGLGLRFSSRQAFTSVQTLKASDATTMKRIAHIADGRDWKTTIVVVNQGSDPAGLTIRFGQSSLAPTATLALESPGLVGLIYTPPVLIPRNGSLWISTQGTSSLLWIGSATITSSGNVDGFAIFRNRFSDAADSEGAVPFGSAGGTRFLLPFDNTSGFVTSMAVVSPDGGAATVRGTFRSSEGVAITSQSGSMSLVGHTAFALTDPAPFGVPSSGVADFTTTGTELFGIGLLFNPRNSFTSLPILKR